MEKGIVYFFEFKGELLLADIQWLDLMHNTEDTRQMHEQNCTPSPNF